MPKHAQATTVSVIVTVADEVTLEVIDDGTGTETPLAAGSGMGLANMRSRAEKLGGTFEMHNVPGGGARVAWRVPV